MCVPLRGTPGTSVALILLSNNISGFHNQKLWALLFQALKTWTSVGQDCSTSHLFQPPSTGLLQYVFNYGTSVQLDFRQFSLMAVLQFSWNFDVVMRGGHVDQRLFQKMFFKAQKLAIKKKYRCSLPPIFFFMLLIFLFILLDWLRVAYNSFNINQDTFKNELKELLSITTTNIKNKNNDLYDASSSLSPCNYVSSIVLEQCSETLILKSYSHSCFKNFYILECAHVDPSPLLVSCR